MFVWAPIPEPYRELGSLAFAEKLAREASVAVSPGVGFGAGRRRVRPLRARRERAPDRPGRARDPAVPRRRGLTSVGTILVDPYPRTLDQIFAGASRARLEALGTVVWHDGPPAGEALVEDVLADAVAIVGQTALPRERLERAPHLRAVMNVEGNFLPNIDYATCFERGIEVLCAAPVFGQPVAELALGLALACARDIPRADRELREGSESLFDDGRNEGAFLLAARPSGCRLRQPGTGVAPAAPALRRAAVGARPVARRRRAARPCSRARRAGGAVRPLPGRVRRLCRHDRERGCDRPGLLRRDGARRGGRDRFACRGRRLGGDARRRRLRPRASRDGRVPRGAGTSRRARTANGGHRALGAPRRQRAGDLAGRWARWWPTTWRRSWPAGRSGACRRPTRRGCGRLRSRPIG